MSEPTFPREGGCLCGRVRFTAGGDPLKKCWCHCPSCRRAAGAPVVAWATYPIHQVRFTAESLNRFESSPGAVRGFCTHCGTTLSYEAGALPDSIDLAIAAFDDPDDLAPDHHIWCRYRLPWQPLEPGAVAFDEDSPPQ
jgi:hypothetical protein